MRSSHIGLVSVFLCCQEEQKTLVLFSIVKILLTKDINIVNDEDDSSNTPLHLAALEGHVKVVEILLECGAAVDAR